MRIPKDTKRFRKDYAKLKKSGRKDITKLRKIMEKLIQGQILNKIHKDHELQGEWQGLRDCHIENDWILIYHLGKNGHGDETITFCATDNHSNLFK